MFRIEFKDQKFILENKRNSFSDKNGERLPTNQFLQTQKRHNEYRGVCKTPQKPQKSIVKCHK